MKKKPTKQKPVAEKIECLKCRRQLAESNFYMNDNELFSTQKSVICKKCLTDYIGEKDSPGYLNRVRMILAILNKPLLSDLWESRGCDFSKYIPQLSSFPQYRGMTFADSTDYRTKEEITPKVIKYEAKSESNDNSDDEGDIFEITGEARKRWIGFKEDEIIQLEDFYQELIMNYEHGTPIQRNLYKNMAITQFKANVAIAEGKNKEYKDLMDTLSKLMNDANIKPVQETGAEANGISSFGEFIKMIEETEPIPEARDEFKDVDGIKKYIDKWFVHTFARVMGLTNDTMEEYDAKTTLEVGDSIVRDTELSSKSEQEL